MDGDGTYIKPPLEENERMDVTKDSDVKVDSQKIITHGQDSQNNPTPFVDQKDEARGNRKVTGILTTKKTNIEPDGKNPDTSLSKSTKHVYFPEESFVTGQMDAPYPWNNGKGK